MRLGVRPVLALAGASLLAAPVAAEGQGKPGDVGRRDDVQLMFAKIGNCLAKDHPKIVRRWLSSLPGSKAEADYVASQVGAMTVCMQHADSRVITYANLAYEPNELRPFVAGAAARSVAVKSPAASPVAPNVPAWFSASLAAQAATDPVNRHALVQQDFGHCVVVANWTASREFILSQPGSAAEGTAVAALASHLGACLPQGTTVELTKASLRRAVSEPFYHLVTDLRQEAAK